MKRMALDQSQKLGQRPQNGDLGRPEPHAAHRGNGCKAGTFA
jgi:hypothetical protein